MKGLHVLLLILSLVHTSMGAELTATQILEKIDKNQVLDHAIVTAKMVIHGRAGTRTITSKSWSEGKDKSFSEYLSPAREKGKKMLKLGDKLWSYTPEPHDRTISISGHLLKQSVMGSDLSYEDFMNNDSMVSDYDAKLVGKEKIEGRDCYVLELTAKRDGVSYARRKIWVDTERFLPVQSDMMAKGGKLLKRALIRESMRVGSRWYPKSMHFKDMLSTGGGTEYHVESIDLKTSIPAQKFTKASLRK
ncbi:MAG: outer membrane lipoprotein-sorting protein [Bdellovibrionales bacterium]|nr:outer membrane lipoprotein-sorting protein [Bdellovibrionales bacterium]